MKRAHQLLIGEWQQVLPATGNERIFAEFLANGRLEYTIAGRTTQRILLTYRVDADTIVTDQPSAPREERTRFELQGQDTLVLFRADQKYVYKRSRWPPSNSG